MSLEAIREREEIESAKRWNLVCTHYAAEYGICKDLRCLPKTGGLNNQDWILVQAFSIIGMEIATAKAKAPGLG